MSATEVKIVNAATILFSQDGVKATNLTKVAAAAGVSRQTLYDIFGNKDELIAAVMRALLADSLVRIRTGWQGRATLDEKLEVFFDVAIREPFDIMQEHPDLKDILLGVGTKTADVAAQADQEKSALLASQLADHQAHLVGIQTTPEKVAAYLCRVAKDLKYTSPTRADLDEGLGLLKLSTLRLLGL